MTWLVSMYVYMNKCMYECKYIYVTLSSLNLYLLNHPLNVNKTLQDVFDMPSFYLFTTFTSDINQMWNMYKYVLKHPLRQVLFKQHIEMSCLVIIS